MSQLLQLIPLWVGAEAYLLKAVQVAQNKAARIVTLGDNYTPIRSLLNQCGWLSVTQLGAFHSLILVYKALKTEYPVYLHKKLSFKPPDPYYRTRTSSNIRDNELLVEPTNLQSDIYKKSFIPRAISQWNKLPLEIRKCASLHTFKNSLKTWIVNNLALE